MKFAVILFTWVKVKFVNIEAVSQLDALDIVTTLLPPDEAIKTHAPEKLTGNGIRLKYIEPEDEYERAIVDEEENEDQARSQHYVRKQDGCWKQEIDCAPTHVAICYEGPRRGYTAIPFHFVGSGKPALDLVMRQLNLKFKADDKSVRIVKLGAVARVIE
jgi:hypothetical protein